MSYNHELMNDVRDVGNANTKEDNERLYRALPDSREQLIVGNMPLVVAVVDAYLKRFPSLENERDDLMSEGFLALIESVDALQGKGITNVSGYLGQSIGHHLTDLGRHHKLPTQQLDVDYSKRTLANVDSLERVDVEDLLRHSCRTAFESSIVELRRQRFTLREIGAEYGINPGVVSRALKGVKARFDALV